jgi:hypothetical protein
MNELYYIAESRMNARIVTSLIDGFPITVDGILYERLSKRPSYRSEKRRLVNSEQTERIILFN